MPAGRLNGVRANSPPDREIVGRLPRFQRGVATYRQLEALGVTPRARRWRVSTGRWRALLPGVVATFSGPVDERRRVIAAWLYAGPSVQITGPGALRIRGLRYVPADPMVRVLVPRGTHRRSTGFVVVRQAMSLDPWPMWEDGVPICGVARAIADTAADCTRLRDVRAVVAEAVQSRLCLPDDLVAQLAQVRRNGSALLRRAVDEVVDGVRSVVEAELRDGVGASTVLPKVLWNPTLIAPDGRLLPSPDGWLPDVGVALEVDSREYHLSPEQWERTLARHAVLTSYGAAVLHFPPSRIRRDLAGVVRVIERTYLERRDAGVCPMITCRSATLGRHEIVRDQGS